MLRAAQARTGDAYQAFPLGGPVRTVDVGESWVDLLDESEIDLVRIRIPLGSKRVLVITSAEDLAGTDATIAQEATAMILDPGVHDYCVDRDLGQNAGPKFYLAIDPTDGGDGADLTRVKIMEGAR